MALTTVWIYISPSNFRNISKQFCIYSSPVISRGVIQKIIRLCGYFNGIHQRRAGLLNLTNFCTMKAKLYSAEPPRHRQQITGLELVPSSLPVLWLVLVSWFPKLWASSFCTCKKAVKTLTSILYIVISNVVIFYYTHAWPLMSIPTCGSSCVFLNEERQLLQLRSLGCHTFLWYQHHG